LEFLGIGIGFGSVGVWKHLKLKIGLEDARRTRTTLGNAGGMKLMTIVHNGHLKVYQLNVLNRKVLMFHSLLWWGGKGRREKLEFQKNKIKKITWMTQRRKSLIISRVTGIDYVESSRIGF